MKKKILFTFSMLNLFLCCFGQAPKSFMFQTAIRNSNGILLNNKPIAIRFTIQQGSVGGAAVYNELFLTNTSNSGLVNIEIGTGTSTSNFSIIDWANGPYFLETAVNFLSGTSWFVIGTSQLLNVPYAFHSNTTDSIYGGIMDLESDPNFVSTITAGITTSDTAIWNNYIDTDTQLDSIGVNDLGFVAGPKTIDSNTQLDSTGIANLGFVAGPKTIDSNTQLDSTGIANLGFVAGPINTFIDTDTQLDSNEICSFGYVAEKTYSIGLCPELGGYIFRISSNGKHGLVAETQNQKYGIRWYACDSVLNNPALHSLNGQKFSDWRLPTKFELNELFLHRLLMGGILTTFWTSTEYDFGKAYVQLFGVNNTGFQTLQAKNNTATVRTIRSF
jgi:hypothetical protein